MLLPLPDLETRETPHRLPRTPQLLLLPQVLLALLPLVLRQHSPPYVPPVRVLLALKLPNEPLDLILKLFLEGQGLRQGFEDILGLLGDFGVKLLLLPGFAFKQGVEDLVEFEDGRGVGLVFFLSDVLLLLGLWLYFSEVGRRLGLLIEPLVGQSFNIQQ